MDLAEWLEDGGPQVVQRDGVSHWLIRQAEDEGDGKPTRFIASTADPDRMRDVVEQKWQLAPYRRNPVILANHDPCNVVGVSVRTAVESDQLVIAVKWDDELALNPLGALIAHQHRAGFRRAVSVGFVPGESVSRVDLPEKHPAKVAPETDRWQAGYLYRKPELLEVSSVSIPANPQALQLSVHARSAATEDGQIERLVGEGLDAKIRAIVLDAVQRDRSVRNAVLALARGTVYDSRNPWAGVFPPAKE